MTRVVVTGANGFVGRALLARLAAEPGVEVVGVVRRARALPARPGLVEVVVAEIDGRTDWSGILRPADVVVHLAARVHQMKEDPSVAETAYQACNVDGTRRLAEACAAVGARRLVFVSSIKVNGDGGSTVYRPDDVPAPTDPYGRSKRDAELAVREVLGAGPTDYVVLRPPVMYGPGVRGNVRRLQSFVDRGVPWPFGRVANRRSLLFVGNLADAIVRAISAENVSRRTYLLSDGEDVSTAELVRAIARARGRTPRLLPLSGRVTAAAARALGRGDLAVRLFGSLRVDPTAFVRDAGWRPPFTLAQGLAASDGEGP